MYTDGPISFLANATLEPKRFVKYGTTGVTYTGAGEKPDGLTLRAAASGDYVACVPVRMVGTAKVTADGVITAGAAVYPAANGKVSATVSGTSLGKAMQAAAADGDEIDLIPA